MKLPSPYHKPIFFAKNRSLHADIASTASTLTSPSLAYNRFITAVTLAAVGTHLSISKKKLPAASRTARSSSDRSSPRECFLIFSSTSCLGFSIHTSYSQSAYSTLPFPSRPYRGRCPGRAVERAWGSPAGDSGRQSPQIPAGEGSDCCEHCDNRGGRSPGSERECKQEHRGSGRPRDRLECIRSSGYRWGDRGWGDEDCGRSSRSSDGEMRSVQSVLGLLRNWRLKRTPRWGMRKYWLDLVGERYLRICDEEEQTIYHPMKTNNSYEDLQFLEDNI